MDRSLHFLFKAAVGLGCVGLIIGLPAGRPSSEAPPPPPRQGSQAVKANQAIFADKLFPVFSHARCSNCHGRVNLVTGAFHATGPAGPSSNCATSGCHTPKEHFPSREWILAPDSMSMAGRDARQACATLKSHITAEHFLALVQTDELIHWAFNPGRSRVPAPGGYETFLKNTEEWVKGGGHCPE